MTSAQVTVEGLPDLRRRLRRMEDDAADLKDANASAAATVASAAAARAPKKSGRLAGSVRGNRAIGRAQVKAGGASTAYAGPVHYGWPAHGIEAQPFVIDAAQETESTWLPQYEQDLARVVDRVS